MSIGFVERRAGYSAAQACISPAATGGFSFRLHGIVRVASLPSQRCGNQLFVAIVPAVDTRVQSGQ